MISISEDRTEVDIAADARLFPPEEVARLPVLAEEELVVDKILAVFGRAEARDFLDLVDVANPEEADHLFELALEKDRGFNPAVFADMARRFERLSRSEFPVSDDRYREVKDAISHWRRLALGISRPAPREMGRNQELDPGPDIGF